VRTYGTNAHNATVAQSHADTRIPNKYIILPAKEATDSKKQSVGHKATATESTVKRYHIPRARGGDRSQAVCIKKYGDLRRGTT